MTHVHFIGIGGSGLSAIARLLVESGYSVSGSDRVFSPMAHELAALGVRVDIGHDPSHVQGADLVIRSSAIPDDNPEVQAAITAHIPVQKRSEYLGQFMAGHTGIAVAGTHGKTTTTAMLAWTLVSLGQDPSYIIGGVSKNLGSNAHAGKGNIFIIEADEYDRMFLGLQPAMILVTNVEYDHPDCYPTPVDYYQAFVDFVHLLKPGGMLITCQDDQGSAKLSTEVLPGCKALVYSSQSTKNYPLNPRTARVNYEGYPQHFGGYPQHFGGYQAVNLSANDLGGYSFEVSYHQENELDKLVSTALQVPGEHNVRNALAVLAAVHQLGLDVDKASQALSAYTGTGRRFDIRGEVEGITIIDDYAHHPTEIRATLAAARTRFSGRRIVAVWQPHTYSRTQTLLKEFAASFKDADEVVVTEVYAAREQNHDFSALQVVHQMGHPNAHFINSLEKVTAHLLCNLQAGDVVLILSAGDADQVSTWLLAGLQPPSELRESTSELRGSPSKLQGPKEKSNV
jgi:UDP-N-acetylmuramate--alanine ligase